MRNIPMIVAVLLLAAWGGRSIAASDLSVLVPTQSESVHGLRAPAEILVDQWGIPHIYAANDHDVFFVQGWNAARDRMWQIDLWRKRGLGLLAGSFGPAYVEQDAAARLLLYRGDPAAEWAELGPAVKTETEAFVEGINAYVAALQSHPEKLPVEFRITGTTPDLWTVDDVVRIRSHGLSGNLISEVQRARVACAAGIETDKYRAFLEPEHTPSIPDGLDPCAVPADVLKIFTLGTKPVTFDKGSVKTAAADDLIPANEAGLGSNNWVIAPGRSVTGRPILANDPHRGHALPSLRYIAHLSAPGLDVIGAGEPTLPGVTIGHNRDIAVGFTISEVDQEDLYVYDLDPADSERYRYGNGTEAMVRVEEMIPVKGEPARPVTLRFTRHGPVLAVDAAHGHAFALRTVWTEPGATPYFASMLFLRARNWDEFSKAAAHWHSPPNNLLYADVKGTIGWTIGASSPVRPNWDGLMPVPGDGRYEWRGDMDPAIFPHLINPARGWLATANDWNLPADFPMDTYKIGYEWSSRSRITRIAEVLEATAKHSLVDSMKLQTDPTSVMARRILARLPAAVPDDPVLTRAAAMLKSWDCRAEIDSAPAALYEIWAAKHLPQAVLAEVVPEPARPLVGGGSIEAIAAILEKNPRYALPPETYLRIQQALWTSLKAAWAEAASLMGDDPKAWAWGKIHRAVFTSAVSPLADPRTAQQLDLQPLAMGGSALSPMAAAYRKEDFVVVHGASFRMVLDVGNWDDSRAINSSGQSGDPYSPFYRNLSSLWTSGQYVPLLYSRAAIEKAAAQRFVLTP